MSIYVQWEDNKTPLNAENLKVINEVSKQMGEDIKRLSSTVVSVEEKLDEKIDSSKNELNSQITQATENKINETKSELNSTIESKNNETNEKIDRINSTVTSEIKQTNSIVDSNKTELNQKIEEAKTELKQEITTLQNGLKSNQSLAYEGHDLKCENTFDGRTENIILEGMTYQNLALNKLVDGSYNPEGTYTQTNIPNGVKLIRGTGVSQWVYLGCRMNCNLLKYNQVYTIIFKLDYSSKALINEKRKTIVFQEQTSSNNIGVSETFICKKGTIITKLKTTTDINRKIGNQIFYMIMSESDFGAEGEWVSVSDIVILEGDYTNSYIPPYFEGIKSVGEKENKISILSCGKNLFESIEKNGSKWWIGANGVVKDEVTNYSILVKITEGKRYTVSGEGIDRSLYAYLDKDLNTLLYNPTPSQTTKEVAPRCSKYLLYYISSTDIKNIKNLQIEEGTVATSYEPYKEDKKEILLPFNDGLKGLLSGAKDIIYNKEDVLCIRQNIGAYTFTNNQNIIIPTSQKGEKTILIYFRLENAKSNQINLMSNLIPSINSNKDIWNPSIVDYPCISINHNRDLLIRINKTSLLGEDESTIKKYLIDNNFTVYYELAEPIETKLSDKKLNLDTYNLLTYVFSDNSISPNIKAKITSNLGSIIQQNAKNINDIYRILDELIIPQITENATDIALLKV